MKLRLNWKKHPLYKDVIIGMAEELPDNMSHFSMMRIDNDHFWVILPAMGSGNFNKRFIFRDPNVARAFCEDYLNYNLREIIKNQIQEMERRSLKTHQPPQYYKNLIIKLEKLMEQHKTPPARSL